MPVRKSSNTVLARSEFIVLGFFVSSQRRPGTLFSTSIYFKSSDYGRRFTDEPQLTATSSNSQMTYGREKNERNGWDGYLSTMRLLSAPSCRNTLVLFAYGSTVDNLVDKIDTPRVVWAPNGHFGI